MPPDQDIFWPQNGRRPGEQQLPAQSVMLTRALDMIDCPLLIVDDERRVEYCNRAAAALLKGAHGGLTLAGDVLSVNTGKSREALEQAVHLACAELQPSGLCVPRPGTPPERWLRMVVAPIYFAAPAPRARRAAIWVLNAESPALPTEQLLEALFGLTRAEARLAIGILTGRSTAEYARLAGVRLATIRSQLHSIFVKTGVRRQAQLVALLSRVPVLQFSGSD